MECVRWQAWFTDGIYLVHEDDARLMIACIVEHLPNEPGTLANVLVDDRARHHLQEVCIQLTRHGLGQQRLAGAGRSIQQTSLGWSNSHSLEQLWIQKRQLDHLKEEEKQNIDVSKYAHRGGGGMHGEMTTYFSQFPDLFRKTSYGRIGNVAWIFVGHVVYQRIHFPRQVSVECSSH